MGKPLLIGTNNLGKAAELALLLDGLGWDVKTLRDYAAVPEPHETGNTFEENAVAKARYFCEQFGVCCIADDSGLAVDALGGAPGVYSARYAGKDADDARNNSKLLDALADVPEERRGAQFVCCIAFVCPGKPPHIEAGTAAGRIAFAARGAGGFGYDPLFIPAGHTRTFGEMNAQEKLLLSHRGNALRKLRRYLETLQ